MNQFKNVFLGKEPAPSLRVATSQKCVRAGGKHNDLDNVGFTYRHHTFFEMLGNFSFGGYFKEEAIYLAWTFLTRDLQIPPSRLKVTYHEEDHEAAAIWRKLGVSCSQLEAGREDNFWSMGDRGPCGPCSEIYYDTGLADPESRWLEIWNLVFMQYDRTDDGKLVPLQRGCIDTGMGLERIASVLQGTISNYEIDTMRHLVESVVCLVERRTGRRISYVAEDLSHPPSCAVRVIVDHLRTLGFLLADGVTPSNLGRGYVFRRILRRAVRYGNVLGLNEPFLATLYPALEEVMGKAYPDLSREDGREVFKTILTSEEETFFQVLQKGLSQLHFEISKLPENGEGSSRVLPTNFVFNLYSSLGFPIDLTAVIARENSATFDESGVSELQHQHQKLSSSPNPKGSGVGSSGLADEVSKIPQVMAWQMSGVRARFTGYDNLQDTSKVLAIARGKGSDERWVCVDPCPFYGQSGGQVGDRGCLVLADGSTLPVVDTQVPYPGGLAVKISVDSKRYPSDPIQAGDVVTSIVDKRSREEARRNHTATHLLHAALRRELGKTVVSQAGSFVSPEKLVLDITYPKALSREQIERIEKDVNAAIENDVPIKIHHLPFEEAVARGATALFTDKYPKGQNVRVIEVDSISNELCGGTHAHSTGELFPFKIISEKSVAAGVRRITAVTGKGTYKVLREKEATLLKIASDIGAKDSSVDDLPREVAKIHGKLKEAQSEIEKLRRELHRKNEGTAGQNGNENSNNSIGEYLLAGCSPDSGSPDKVKVRLRFGNENEKEEEIKRMVNHARAVEPDLLHVFLFGPRVMVSLNPQRLPQVNAKKILDEVLTSLAPCSSPDGVPSKLRGGGTPIFARGVCPPSSDFGSLVKRFFSIR
eukprot:TRINITY_DN2241_c0_g1_i2.p1 TRINITY_DN2241_c0_g1~~TRINITY_DN2241_c0_g1_i2.p1  ORF type:complete len:941 (-),score=189.46 TRINITY_DN2241_c0_g1_i2:32-2665(-)